MRFLIPHIFLCSFALSNGRESFQSLHFDGHYFLCDHYEDFCSNALDEIGCGVEPNDRTILGCSIPQQLASYSGTCTCHNPIHITKAGLRVTQQIISNRMPSSDVHWMLEPYVTGPPYDIKLSYKIICKETLDRLGCPVAQQTVSAADGNDLEPDQFACTCGLLTEPSNHVLRLIFDYINLYEGQSHPVFSNPVMLSVSMSACCVLLVGKLGAVIAVYFKLPAIVGFLLAGVGIQNFLNLMFLKGAGYPFPSPASELKNIALIIVLMRAGFALHVGEIKKTLVASISLCTLPYFCEFFFWLYCGKVYFGWSTISMGLFASIQAPLGPSVIISALLNILAVPKVDFGYVPKQILTSTPIEAVVSIILFWIFANLEQTTTDSMYPWVKVLPLWLNCVLIPVNILFSTVLGVLVGWLASLYINWRVAQVHTHPVLWESVNRNPQLSGSTGDLVYVLVVVCYTFFSLCNKGYIQQCSGVLVVFVISISASKFINHTTGAAIGGGLKGIWTFAEVFLFTLTGTSLSFDSSNGPLYGQRGLNPSGMQLVIWLLFVGTGIRSIGIAISILLMYPSLAPHRRKLKWLIPFWLNCWIFQMPKATVHATMGKVAYDQHLIPGAIGLNQALVISQATAFAVLIFAPIGAFLTQTVGSRLSRYLAKLDSEAGWSNENLCYENCRSTGLLSTEAQVYPAADDAQNSKAKGTENNNHDENAFKGHGITIVPAST